MATEKVSTQNDPQLRKGGYHSQGVPGEEAALRKPMRVVRLSDRVRPINQAWPVKGGMSAESTSAGRLESAAPTGERVVYALVRQGTDQLETPVFTAGKEGEQEAIAVFTDRNLALNYLDGAGWQQTHELAPLSPRELGPWLEEARADGIHMVAVNLGSQGHGTDEPQPVLFLDELRDRTGEALYGELMALGEQ